MDLILVIHKFPSITYCSNYNNVHVLLTTLVIIIYIIYFLFPYHMQEQYMFIYETLEALNKK